MEIIFRISRTFPLGCGQDDVIRLDPTSTFFLSAALSPALCPAAAR